MRRKVASLYDGARSVKFYQTRSVMKEVWTVKAHNNSQVCQTITYSNRDVTQYPHVISRSVTSRRGTARRHAACDHVVQNKFIPWHVKTCHCPDTWLQSFIPDAVPYPAWYPDLQDSAFFWFLGVSELEHGKQLRWVVGKKTFCASWHYHVTNLGHVEKYHSVCTYQLVSVFPFASLRKGESFWARCFCHPTSWSGNLGSLSSLCPSSPPVGVKPDVIAL